MPSTPDFAPVEQALSREDPQTARAELLKLLDGRDDPLALLTLKIMTQTPFAPDAMAAALDRLVALVRAQDAQIRDLQALIDSRL